MTGADRYDALFRAHAGPILRYLQRRTGPDDAADLMAEVFLVAWRRLPQVPADTELLWLYGVAHRVLANHYRSSRRRTALVEELATAIRNATPADIPTAADLRVRAALTLLKARDRELLTLAVWEELTASEIATVTGLSAGTVRVRLHRARARLRSVLDDEPSAEPAVSCGG